MGYGYTNHPHLLSTGQPFGDLAARNPWWRGTDGFAADPHIAKLASAPFRREPSALQSIRVDGSMAKAVVELDTLGGRTHQDHRDVSELRPTLYRVGEPQAVEARHQDVGEDDVRVLTLDELEADYPVIARYRRRAAWIAKPRGSSSG